MIVPSIDIMGGETVQLIGGETHALSAGDPESIAEKFSRVGEMAVIDLDAAMGKGNNREPIQALCKKFACRVGGGIRDEDTARFWLDAGAQQIIIGTAAEPSLLSKLPKERLIVALDARHGEVVVDGWQTKTGLSIVDRMQALREYVSGFLVTFVENEGRMKGTQMARVAELVDACGDAKLTIAGGVTTPSEIAELDAMGVDAQVGMALYTGRLSLAEAFAAPMTSDRPDGLWPTVVVDQYDRALGLCYSNLQSLETALEDGKGVYWSRKRGLWIKGEQSGHTQKLLEVSLDCDRDTLRFKVIQVGRGFCHLGTKTCWGGMNGLPTLAERLKERTENAPESSYTKRLLTDHDLLTAKLIEEAQELAEANTSAETAWETADLLYFALVAMVKNDVHLSQVEQILDKRMLAVTRRPGNAKTRSDS